jgi:hypothetical protein
MNFEIGEQIALAITYAMRDEMGVFRAVMAHLREEGWSDEKIGNAFMEVGKIVFAEEESKKIGEEE